MVFGLGFLYTWGIKPTRIPPFKGIRALTKRNAPAPGLPKQPCRIAVGEPRVAVLENRGHRFKIRNPAAKDSAMRTADRPSPYNSGTAGVPNSCQEAN